jgi:hemoglobin-like flavoprotein
VKESLSAWEEELNDVLEAVRRSSAKLSRLKSLVLSGKISKETYEDLIIKFEADASNAEKRRRALVETLSKLQKELSEQARLFESLTSSLEAKLASSAVSEDHYVKVSTALKYGLEETVREMESVSNALTELYREAPEPDQYLIDKAMKRVEKGE